MEKSYFATLLALIVHQIDAAYWHEWELFHLPGGVQGYLLFNLLALPVVLLGYRHVLLGSPQARVYARVCAALGIGTFLIHAGFAGAGERSFHLPLSMAVIGACLLAGLWLGWRSWRPAPCAP
ncbi:hypothetical protein KQ945_16255 [Bacillus subtilis subsp. subtilis]|nr:hypothetical protein [Bacillus subtilis subsp. subtilis]